MFASLQDFNKHNANSSNSSLSINEYLSLSSNNTSVNSNVGDKNLTVNNKLHLNNWNSIDTHLLTFTNFNNQEHDNNSNTDNNCQQSDDYAIDDNEINKVQNLENIKNETDVQQNDKDERIRKAYSLNNDFLQCVDGKPAKPPNYHSINNINQRITFPVFENNSGVSQDVLPPKYTPAINELIIVSLKMERISPYEPSTSRNWKTVILEINSTQLNFYSMDDYLLKRWKKILDNDSNDIPDNGSNRRDDNNYKLLKHIKQNRKKYLIDSAIIKTYTLQYATYGIPVDYNKKPFVLRLRCEIEQFLLNFYHVDNLILWSTYLSIGISVSLDLEFRELPDYRVVPRRRRRRNRRNLRKIRRRFSKNDNEITQRTIRTSNSQSSFHKNSFFESNTNSSSMLNTRFRSYSLSSLVPNSNGKPGLTTSKIEKMLGISDCEYLDVPTNLNDIGQMLLVPSDQHIGDKQRRKILDHSNNNNSNNLLRSKMKNLFGSANISNGNSNNNSTIKKNRRQSVSSFLGLSNNYTKRQTTTTIKYSTNLKTNDKSKSFPKGSMKNNITNIEKCTHKNASVEIVGDIINEQNESCDESITTTNFDDEIDSIRNDDDQYDDDDNDDDNDDDDDDNNDLDNNTGNTPSVYVEEGIYHDDSDDDSDFDDDETIIPRNRALSNPLSIEYGCYESDDYKWSPTTKELSRKRYIRDSIRCIKPFVENQEWIGHVVFKPTKEPIFKTNNEPIWTGNYTNKRRIKYLSTNKFSHVKNHYLKAYIVGNVGLLKADSKMVYRDDSKKQKLFI